MRLKVKALLTMVSVLAAIAVVGAAIGRYVVLPSFTQLENREATRAAERCARALEQEANDLLVTCRDWAYWDDTYRFVQDRNASYTEANLLPEAMQTLHLSLFCILGPRGNVVWSYAAQPRTGKPAELPDFPRTGLPRSHPLLARSAPGGRCGFWTTAWGPMAVAVVPITTSDRKAPPRGVIIMGRAVTDSLASSVARRLGEEMYARGVGDPRWSPTERALAMRLGRQGGCELSDHAGGSLDAYAVVPDLQGRSALLVRAVVPKDITEHGRAATRALALSVLLALACLGPMAVLLLQHAVVHPVVALTRHALQIAQSGDLSERLALRRRDEIGVLAAQFDAMLERLADTRARLLSRSYQSGMQEMAAGTLHNVRNALAPTVVSIEEAQERLEAARPASLEAAATELAGGGCSDDRRRDLERYMELAAHRMTEAVRATHDDLAALAEQVSRVERMLPDMGACGRLQPVTEEFPLSASVESALALVPAELRQALEIWPHQSLAEVGLIRGVRITVDQVLANLVINAAEARNGERDRPVHVDLGASLETSDSTPMVHLRVNDDGCGMAPETVARAFENGFTTKRTGSGLGLHWCANAIHAMGGRMSADSSGVGQGSCLHVLLPAGNGRGGTDGG